jgi:hypothetical protein
MKRYKYATVMLSAVMLIAFSGCQTAQTKPAETETETTVITKAAASAAETALSAASASYTERDLAGTYDESEAVYADLSALNGDYTITQSGVYVLSGTLTDGQILVNAGEDDKVQIVLNGASVSNSDGAAIYAVKADKVFVTVVQGTRNALSDGGSYAEDAYGNTPDGCIFSKCDLTINGTGTLTVDGNYKFGIVGKDDIVIADVTLNIVAEQDGISGKDSVSINSGTIGITAGGDGISSVNDDDAEQGMVQIDGGTITINTGGSSADSQKGVKAQYSVIINGGSIVIDAEDDAIHSGEMLTVTGGTLTLASGDDGMHCDDTLVISGGDITITESYEGIEAGTVTVSGGMVDVTASDDGFNAAGGSDDSAYGNSRGAKDSFASDTGKKIVISGGTILVNAGGDGLDSNGSLTVTGGFTYISGPTNSGNGALDAGQATISGGVLVAAGSSGMATGFGSASEQCSLMYTYQSTQSAGTLMTLTDADGNTIISFAPQKDYQNVVISSPEMINGSTYMLYSGGSVSGGTLSGGTLAASITLSGMSTTSGTGGGMSSGGFNDRQSPGGGQAPGGGRRG